MPVADDVKQGINVTIHHPVTQNIYGCEIGDNTRIGADCEIGKGVVIGKNCVISAKAYICTGVVLEDSVFIGPKVGFTNTKYPQARESLPANELLTTLVKRGADIGCGAIILPGITIGVGARVGAGSVVTKDVPDGMTVMGNPAKATKGKEKEWLFMKEACSLLNVHPNTLRNWVEKGHIECTRMGKSGHRRFLRSDVVKRVQSVKKY